MPRFPHPRRGSARFAALLGARAARAAPPATRGPLRERVATVLEQRIHYVQAGRGQPMILLHGLGMTKETWLPSFGALAGKHRVYAIDQIGLGRSDKPDVDYTIATFVDFLHGFLVAQKLGQATLVGSSLGGWIALEFAVRHPDMVDRLVLVGSAGLPWLHPAPVDFNPTSLAATRARMEALVHDKKRVTEPIVRQVFADHLRNNDGSTIQRTFAGLASSRFVDGRLASIRVPTLVVWGREDEMIPLAAGEMLRDGIAGARLVVFDHCGHLPHVEMPAEFTRAVLEFLGT